MCWDCDHPASRMDEHLATLRRCIDARGWAVQVVERDRAHPPWAYTVGLTLRGLPELVVTGMPVLEAGRLLDDTAEHLAHSCVPSPGRRFALEGGPLLEVVRVARPWAHLLVSARLFGEGIEALQLVHADESGNWPWDSSYQGVLGGQPVLGVRASPPSG
ncbi:DUF4262 domain-containing protein [Lentzea flava]|uniref:DUF4262 domain-containing protein n=1 Tax=Lentzea flava TaxID=103732 RepID=A0ABQ2UUW6_9PSEU|nr:DUF4262 domain-containing protein [Lentzea flava]MCP2201408.1 protein of unknown function (DUF4262) [Lentzea flava]GGU51270.1 hypothetical protein GCM10010178_50120 [Lentzea flava]